MAGSIDKLIEELSKQNNVLKNVLEEHERLTTRYNETSRERLQRLNEDVNKQNEVLERVIQAIEKDLNTKIDINNLPDGLKAMGNSIRDKKKAIAELNEELGDLRESLKEVAKGSAEFDEINDKIKKLKTSVKSQNAELEEQEEAYNLLKDAAEGYYSAVNKAQEEFNRREKEGLTLLDDIQEKFEQKTKNIASDVKKVTSGVKEFFSAATKSIEPWTKAQDASYAFARTTGMSVKNAEKYLDRTAAWADKNNIGLLFGKTTAELIELQNQYTQVLGRNVELSGAQMKDMLSMEKFLGSEGTMELVNNLENFGLGISDSADFVKKTMNDATKYGISASKLTKTISENIKMAQNYTFKNGLEGLANMAKKAIQLKTDMSLVSSFAEQVSTVEGAISTGAQLQVLGGTYAMGSDPLSMMYDSLMNYEGLFDRAVGMAKGKVHYNEQTQNFEMGGFERYMMKQAAKVMGVDSSKLIDAAFRQASLDKIENAAKKSNIGDDAEMVELVKNLATWRNGEAYVTVNGKEKAVSELTTDDKGYLEASTKNEAENLMDMAVSLRSINDFITGEQAEINNEQANNVADIAKGIHGLLKNNESFLDDFAGLAAWFNILFNPLLSLSKISWNTTRILWKMGGGIAGLFNKGGGGGLGNLFGGKGGGLGTAAGGTASAGGTAVTGGKVAAGGTAAKGGGGFFNFFGGGGKAAAGSSHGIKAGQTIVGKNGTTYQSLGNGSFKNMKTGKTVSGAAAKNIAKGASTSTTNVAKSASRFGSGVGSAVGSGIGAGLLSGGISLIGDMMSGEYQKDKDSSITRAVGNGGGAAIGAAIGTAILPGIGTLIGGMLGGMGGGWLADSYNAKRAEENAKKKAEMARKHEGSFGNAIASLAGNYDASELGLIEKALEDGAIANTEVGKDLWDRLKANGDISNLETAGIVLNTYSNGGRIPLPHARRKFKEGSTKEGVLNGPSHAQGGIPFTIKNDPNYFGEMEGGEVVVSKQTAEENPETINKLTNHQKVDGTMEVKEKPYLSSVNHTMRIQNSPMDVNMSGTIMLAGPGGNYAKLDYNELANNEVFQKHVAKNVYKQFNVWQNKALNMDSSKLRLA